ncbi:MAG: hypothetical protein ILO42_06370 [Clostridia bacterium]|nr:hypothetical protein [Clostridia bacterium]
MSDGFKKVKGKKVKVSVDGTGGVVSVDWICPHCLHFNAGFYFCEDAGKLKSDFELDHACDACGKVSTIVCRNSKPLFKGR